ANDGAYPCGQLAKGEVAREVAELVIDVLEQVDVEHDKRERTRVARRTEEFAFQELEQVAFIVNLRQCVDDGEPVDLFVVFRLNVAAGEKSIDAVSNAEVIAVVNEHSAEDGTIVDEGSIGAHEIGNEHAVFSGFKARVFSGDGMILN